MNVKGITLYFPKNHLKQILILCKIGLKIDNCFILRREAMQKEKAENAENAEEPAEVPPEPESDPVSEESQKEGAETDDAEEKAAVVLQSNYRGYRERKKYKEHREQNKTSTEDEPAASSSIPAEEDNSGQDPDTQEEEQEKKDETEAAEETTNGDFEQENKAATVIQSNFRGHKERKRLQEEGKLPVRGQKEIQNLPNDEDLPVPDPPTPEELMQLTEISGQGVEEPSGNEETKAAVVIQSNFRGHKERKRLQEEGKLPNKKAKEDLAKAETSELDIPIEELPPPLEELESGETTASPSSADEEHAATVLQSNFRGHQERKRLKAEREAAEGGEQNAAEEGNEEENITDNDLEQRGVDEEEGVQTKECLYDEEQAAIKIQSNFRGYKDRKNLKATAQQQDDEADQFFNQVMIFK